MKNVNLKLFYAFLLKNRVYHQYFYDVERFKQRPKKEWQRMLADHLGGSYRKERLRELIRATFNTDSISRTMTHTEFNKWLTLSSQLCAYIDSLDHRKFK